ncbi:MAG TPA: hypothetical protein PLP17_01615 [Oligoflexia bacterium]|nr:hypothetical protein [Oligoflexia bacterium]
MTFLRITILICVAFQWNLFCAHPVCADDSTQKQTVAVVLDSTEALVRAYGMVVMPPVSGKLSPGFGPAALRRREANIEAAGEGKWRVSVELEDADLRANAVMTVVATTGSGRMLPGVVTVLKPELTPVQAANMRCGPSTQYQELERMVELSEAELRKLLAVRAQQKELLRQLLEKMLTQENKAKIAELEKRRGVAADSAFDAGMPLVEISRRAGVMRAVVEP